MFRSRSPTLGGLCRVQEAPFHWFVGLFTAKYSPGGVEWAVRQHTFKLITDILVKPYFPQPTNDSLNCPVNRWHASAPFPFIVLGHWDRGRRQNEPGEFRGELQTGGKSLKGANKCRSPRESQYLTRGYTRTETGQRITLEWLHGSTPGKIDTRRLKSNRAKSRPRSSRHIINHNINRYYVVCRLVSGQFRAHPGH